MFRRIYRAVLKETWELFDVKLIDYDRWYLVLENKDKEITAHVDEVEMEDSTGYFDANDQLIYEGDIVKTMPEKEMYRVVVYSGGEYFLHNYAFPNPSFSIGAVNTSHKNTIVVWNKHNNPELYKLVTSTKWE